MSTLDLAGLVLVAGRTLGLEEEAVLGLADLEGAAAVLAQVRDAPGGPEGQAATQQAGLVRRTVEGIADIRVSDEGREGIQSFLGKRKPGWQT